MTSEAGWAESLRTLFPSDDIIASSLSAVAQNPAFAAAADACLVAEAETTPWTVDTLKQLSATATAPLFVLADSGRSQWEEAALFAGAEQIFRRPLRASVLQLAISRSQRRRLAEAPVASPVRGAAPARDSGGSAGLLSGWRHFARLLNHAHDTPRLLTGFIEQLREVLRCNRILLYTPAAGAAGLFSCAAASGVEPALFEPFRLALRSGLAQLLAERGTAVALHRLRVESGRETAAARELAVFGAELALPVLGRDGLAAILILGPRVCGLEYGDEEVALVYQSVEPLAAVLGASAAVSPDERITGAAMLDAMPVAAAVVTSNLRFVLANATFTALIGRPRGVPVTAEELPSTWSAAIAAAVQSNAGSARVELEHRSIGTPRKVRLSVRRIELKAAADPMFIVTVEDIVPPSPHDSDPHSIGNLLQRAGEQLSNEFRNALTPVDIMVQLSHEASTTRGELEQLSAQVSTAMHRLRRRIDDLAYLTKSAIIPEPTTVSAVLRFTRERLDEWVDVKHFKRIVWLNEFSETPLMADARALAVALAELVLNAIEACEGKQVTVTAEDAPDTVSFRVRNAGIWAPPAESSGFRHRPFVSSKSTGVGLGVEVASRVAEHHGGRLVLGPVAPDTVEALLRVPRVPASEAPPPEPRVETRVARAL